ncbi:iron-containing alcohol dehydrogenase [Paraburkholderia caribensis]|uniref:iron-containing alcohol dehydrogenase n=1 Tax=Paraburkholderia TaxID=1822464 RepID=UPI001CB1057F|nr:iron-containing alcohol dehydrogenase [Paraburkholderia caribensis]BEU25654.1 iron-containing alcohol dehydrogenase [Paraburkholderia sp. 22B1P]CAG9262384.1 Long-chain-alcohol dehydrogenase 1 [Paraburkholderia caribensis]
MNPFQFHSPASIVVETGAATRIGDFIHAQKVTNKAIHSLFVVTDAGVLRAGLLDASLSNLRDKGISVEVFSNVEADPSSQTVETAAQAARDANADAVLGFGGGSPMDVAKLVTLLAAGSQTLNDVYGVGVARGPRLPLILVPTTAGTGSEATPIAIVTTGEGQKKGVVSPLLIPDCAVLDAVLTVGLPRGATAATGIDAMVHAIESYTSKRLKNPISDSLARDALRLLAANIERACDDGTDLVARQAMLLGASLAGLAFANAPVAAVHALAYPVGARFHVPHGLSNSLVLPAVMRFNLESAIAPYAELASIAMPTVAGTDEAKAQVLIEWLSALPGRLGLPTRLSQVGISASDMPSLAADAMEQTRLLVNNPREVTYNDALALYESSL